MSSGPFGDGGHFGRREDGGALGVAGLAGSPHGRFLDGVYQGYGEWDIGRPQPEVVRLSDEGRVRGAVLDLGCGSGENALLLAARGHEVWGLDSRGAAVEKAKAKARERRLGANFAVADALRLHELRRAFDTVLDVGLFHCFDDEQRRRYVSGLAHAVAPGGALHLLAFSEREPGEGGPRRVTRDELRAAFRAGWLVRDIRPARLETRVHDDGARAWLATVERQAATAWLRA